MMLFIARLYFVRLSEKLVIRTNPGLISLDNRPSTVVAFLLCGGAEIKEN